MAVYWMTEALPLGVTALLPIVALPVLGITGAKQAASNYIKDSNMVFMGGLIMAISLEKSGLHKRMALRILMFIGTSPARLLFGFMLASWFLSMWISNAAATAMMMPVAEAALQQLKHVMTQHLKPIVTEIEPEVEETAIDEKQEQNNSHVVVVKEPKIDQHMKRVESYLTNMCKMFSLGVCYAANVGGNATLMGNTPNLVFKGMLDEIYERYGLISPINYTSWIPFALPGSFICFIIAWVWLQIFSLGFKSICPNRAVDSTVTERATRSIIIQEYNKLGPMTYVQ
ncbi:hypothetical protein CAPTEDRAFT_211152 [Capitella teleta]|uniref:Uncharacterized protein n=1 Tax=Capitella teleta TaxID=283909 RepID=R7UED1_CAPTE|nr:hypothetical protein CAPTEDRAFT_211152 [Capitella teleta]|eukprot:ELU04339.1 hypothetical protein CAPTEDRAFT_211152 [Capitella teleta]